MDIRCATIASMSKKFQVKAVPGRNNDAGGGAAAEAGPSQPTFTLSAPGKNPVFLTVHCTASCTST